MDANFSNYRSLAAILQELKEELQEFVQTRLELIRSELQEKAASVLAAIPLALSAALLLATAFLLFSFALVALIAAGFVNNPYRWFFGTLLVAVVWSLGGGVALWMAKRRVSKQAMIPRKTLEVLNNDKAWLEKETRKAA